jgi:hypothetical protein
VIVPFDGKQFTVAIGVMDESIGKIPAEWRIDVSYERMMNKFGSWFRAKPTKMLVQISEIIYDILRSDSRIHELSKL